MLQFERRMVLAQIAALIGASALPETALAAPKRRGRRQVRYLDTARFALLSAIADTFVPRTDTAGAIEAGVPAVFDGLLANWASPKRRSNLIGGLDRIDAAARAQHKVAFAKLTPAKRKDVLLAYEATAMKPVPRKTPESAMSIFFGSEPSVVDPAYANLKDMLVTLYYQSEIGLTQELQYTHVPGRWQPSVPVTSATRPAGGPGRF